MTRIKFEVPHFYVVGKIEEAVSSPISRKVPGRFHSSLIQDDDWQGNMLVDMSRHSSSSISSTSHLLCRHAEPEE